MTKRIYKYEVGPNDASIRMPAGAKILSCAEQGDKLMLWAEVDHDAPMRHRGVEVVPTGSEIDGDWPYVGTAHFYDGKIVLHVYVEPED